MAVAAKVSSAEVSSQIAERFVDKYLEVRLINTGAVYQPGVSDDATFLAAEIPIGTGGYQRAVIGYDNTNVANYGASGVSLSQKASVFAHDGSGDVMTFNHAALVWSEGNVSALGANTAAPSAGVDGTYTNIPIDSTDGSGVGLLVDLEIVNSGAAATDYVVTVKNAGYGYAASDVLTILGGTLAGLGATASDLGNLVFTVGTASTNDEAGNLVAISKTTNDVQLTAGNEAAFYWNLKLYGVNPS